MEGSPGGSAWDIHRELMFQALYALLRVLVLTHYYSGHNLPRFQVILSNLLVMSTCKYLLVILGFCPQIHLMLLSASSYTDNATCNAGDWWFISICWHFDIHGNSMSARFVVTFVMSICFTLAALSFLHGDSERLKMTLSPSSFQNATFSSLSER